MTFRQFSFSALEAFLCFLLWSVAHMDTETSKELADTLPWVIAFLMLVPLARFRSDDVLTALKTWRDGTRDGV